MIMKWQLNLALTFAILVITCIVMYYNSKRRTGGKRYVETVKIILVGMVASAFMLLFPLTVNMLDEGTVYPKFYSHILTAFNTIKLFISDGEIGWIRDIFNDIAEEYKNLADIYKALFAIYIVAAPLATFSFVLSFFKNLSAYAKMISKTGKDAYVFSELNEKSLALAEDIKNTAPKDRFIIFTDVFSKNDEKSYEMLERAERLGALCFKADIITLNFWFHSKKKSINLFTIGEDHSENISQSLRLIEKYKARNNVNLYAFSTQVESELLLASAFIKEVEAEEKAKKAAKSVTDEAKKAEARIKAAEARLEYAKSQEREALEELKEAKERANKAKSDIKLAKEGIKLAKAKLEEVEKAVTQDGYELRPKMAGIRIRRINEVQSLINRTLYDSGYENIFEAAYNDGSDTKKINAIVIGMGSHGTEMTKALSWFCQMDGYEAKIDSFDMDDDAEEKFIALCPDLMSKEFNGQNLAPEDTSYTIKIHPGYDVTTKKFENAVAAIDNITYIFIALGDDEKNIYTAVKLRTLLKRKGLFPKIQAVVYNSDKKEALYNIKNFSNQEYQIDFIGDVKSSYSEKVIVHSDIEDKALKKHLEWGGFEPSFWQYDYNYKSSSAWAIHRKMKKKARLPGLFKEIEDRTKEERDDLRKLEHRRWNAYMRSEGYTWSKSTEKPSRDTLAKKHNLIVPFEELPEEEKNKDDY